MQRVTTSSLACFRSCPRKYLHEYLLGRRRVTEGAPLAIGRFAHTLLEAWWSGGREAVLATLTGAARDITPEDAAKVAAMLHGYNPKLPDGRVARDNFKVAALEQTFDGIKIVNPDTSQPMRTHCLAGKVDGLLLDAEGQKWVLEHKTTSDEIMGYGPFWQRLSIDHQISYYMLATGAVGVLYDVLRKPEFRICQIPELDATGARVVVDATGVRVLKKDGAPRQTADTAKGYTLKSRAETPDEYQTRVVAEIEATPERYYQFRSVVKTPADILEAQADLWAQAHMLADCERANRWPRNSGACRSFFGVCEYLGVCVGSEQIDDDTLFRTKAGQNEELAA
ncbi:MAG: hypothetical protein FD189_1053 [Elusimicrobia bacterium]|nr:MAG: hypothetical protein FD189_1053 [Elusimicrobiota bacterium]